MSKVRFTLDLDVVVDPGHDDPDDPVFLAAANRKREAVETALRSHLHQPTLTVSEGVYLG